jgi:hypothetical protein
MEWYQVVELVQKYIVQISTPRGSGSGFLVSRSDSTGLCAIATAAHVVNDSNWWEEPIRLHHPISGKTQILHHLDRAIVFRHEMDTAAVLFKPIEIPFPAVQPELIPESKYLKVGNEIGWLGFPAVSPIKMCFFSGRVSAWLQDLKTYLVDGVAINGVSGGPALAIIPGDKWVLIGVISAYIPNRATGEVLPGLTLVRDVNQFQELTRQFSTIDAATMNQHSQPPQSSAPKGESIEK